MKTAQRTDGPTSMAASINGPAFVVEQMLNYSAQVIMTGAPVGTLQLQGSNDAFEGPVGNQMYQIENPNAHWDTITGSSIAVSTAADVPYDVADVGYRYYRVQYVRTSGTGSMTVKHFAKGRI